MCCLKIPCQQRLVQQHQCLPSDHLVARMRVLGRHAPAGSLTAASEGTGRQRMEV